MGGWAGWLDYNKENHLRKPYEFGEEKCVCEDHSRDEPATRSGAAAAAAARNWKKKPDSGQGFSREHYRMIDDENNGVPVV